MSCTLSPSAAAFSTMLSAFTGSVLNGLFSGLWIAFFTGWIAWLSVFRILGAGFYELHLSIKAGTQFQSAEYSSLEMTAQPQTPTQTDFEAQLKPQSRLARAFHPERKVDVWGWLGWIWSAIYTPISHSIWLAVHFDAPGSLQFVRALAIGVSALSLTFDYKARYAACLGRKFGSWAFVLFNFWNAGACILLGVEALVLLIHGAMNIDFMGGKPIPLFVAYPIFATVWAVASWKFLPPIDGSRPGVHIVADVAMGAFAGLFVAAPAFALWRNAAFEEDHGGFGSGGSSGSGGMDLGEFLSCQGASVLEKFAAVMP
jgi:hypothetical protein